MSEAGMKEAGTGRVGPFGTRAGGGPNAPRRPGAGALLCLCGALLILSPACGGVKRWSLRTAQPDFVLQWPYQPNKAKVTFERSLTGLAQQKGSASKVKAFFIGAEAKDRDAFALPVAAATGSDGRIAVADMGRRCVHLFIPAQQLYLRLDGTKEEKILSPVGVVFDDALRLYLSDSSGKVFAFGPGGESLFIIRKASAEILQRPTGLAWSPRTQRLYVVDTLANRIHAFNTKGEEVFSFGQRGEETGRFNFPTHIFWSAGELYVTDSLDFRIAIFDETGKAIGSFGRHGDGSGDLAMPKGIAVDKDGIIYVVDSLFDNVQLFNRRGDFLLTLGRRGVDFGEFWLPSGAFISDNGELYVCDTYNGRVQVFRITERYADNLS
jgi:DNA-binding beta-propeller fold protein YncE